MILPLRTPPSPPSPPLLLYSSISFRYAISSINLNKPPLMSISISILPKSSHFVLPRCRSDIDMVQTPDGVYAPKQSKVVVLWDLDNKPPRGPPYEAALALKRVAKQFGRVVEISAYANQHAFSHLPNWVLEERRERRRLDVFERKGIVTPSEAYVCSVCGRKCKTHLDLKKHFRQLHERERQKKLTRMKQLKGKKKQRFKERYLDKNYKYEEAARKLITPKVGYGLAKELRRPGVFVKTVEDKPQAADWALKRQMLHSMNRGIDWLFLVSDDSDFRDMLRRAREADLGTFVVGDQNRALGRYAVCGCHGLVWRMGKSMTRIWPQREGVKVIWKMRFWTRMMVCIQFQYLIKVGLIWIHLLMSLSLLVVIPILEGVQPFPMEKKTMNINHLSMMMTLIYWIQRRNWKTVNYGDMLI